MAWRLRFIPKGLDQVPTCDSSHVSPLASVGLLRIGLGVKVLDLRILLFRQGIVPKGVLLSIGFGRPQAFSVSELSLGDSGHTGIPRCALPLAFPSSLRGLRCLHSFLPWLSQCRGSVQLLCLGKPSSLDLS